MSVPRTRLGDERGFTLVELLVTSSLAIVVLFAILGASEMFARSASIADKTTEAQDSARATVRSMVNVLRQARAICATTCPPASPTTPIGGTPTRSDLVVAAYLTTSGVEQAGWVRYCATSDPHPSLVMGTLVSGTYLPAGACSATNTANGWHHTVMLKQTLQDSARLFDYAYNPGSAAVADIQSVGIRLAVGTSPTAAATHNSVVRDAVSFRNRSST